MKAYSVGKIFVLLLLARRCFSFNVDLVTARTYTSPGVTGSYFGYKVSLHSPDASSKWLLVGAPLEKTTGAQQRGGVYKCYADPLDNRQCEIIPIDNKAEDNSEVKENQWLGGSLYSTSRKVIACAPRYLRYYRVEGKRQSFLNGKCFSLSPDNFQNEKELDPCGTADIRSNCQAGFSAQLTDTGRVVLGAVGRSRWEGSIITFNQNSEEATFSTGDQIDRGDYMGYSVAYGHFTARDKTEFAGGAPRGDKSMGKVLIYGDASNQLQVLSQLPQPKDIKLGSYFGSVICAVDLNNDRFTDILVGAPQYSDNQDEGRVFVYINNGQGAVNYIESMTLSGDNTKGAQFGSAIAAVGDLNKDGFQDVVIGAPFYGPSRHGAVFIYYGTRDGVENTYRQKILASKLEKPGEPLRMFGASVSGGVDVDGNKYNDFSVGAFGSDKVVLFRTKRIIDVKANLKLSNTEIVLENNATLCEDPSDNNRKHKCINITVEFKFEDKEVLSQKGLDLLYSITLDKEQGDFGRMYLFDNKKPKSILKDRSCSLPSQGKWGCKSLYTVYLKDKNQIVDKLSLLTILVDFDIKPDAKCKTALCPILNAYTPKQVKGEVSFLKECAGSVCKPDLVISSSVDTGAMLEGQPLLKLGTVNELTVNVVVENRARDAAYRARVVVIHPAGIGYIGLRLQNQGVQCDNVAPNNGTGTITCDVGNPLNGHKNRTFGIVFSISEEQSAQKQLAGKEKRFKINLETMSANQDFNGKDNKQDVFVRVSFEADLAITGTIDRREVTYSGKGTPSKPPAFQNEIGPLIVQTFMVTNKGPSSVDSFTVSFSLPVAYLLQVELTGSGGSCNTTVNDKNIKANNTVSSNTGRRKRRDVSKPESLNCNKLSVCRSFNCRVGRLQNGQVMNIKVTSRIWDNLLIEGGKPKTVKLISQAEVKVPENSQKDEKTDNNIAKTELIVKPRLESKEKTVPIWIPIVSAVAGAVLLGIATFFMYRRGWFKRKRYRDITGPTQEGEIPTAYQNMANE